MWPMWLGERVAFVSDHEGIANIYSVLADGSDLQRLTGETEYYVRFPATDGKRIVYTAGADIRVLDLASGTVTTPPVSAPSTAPQAARRFIPASEDLEDFQPSPDGTSVAFVARGRAFTMPLWEEAVVEHGEGSRVRQRCAAWLADSNRFVCVSDAGGRERIEIHQTRREDEPVIAIDEDLGRVVELVASPVADVVAIANHRYELLIVDLEDKTVRVVDKSAAAHIRDLAFSPDGRWLAYRCAPSAADESSSIIRIAKVKSGAVHDATALLRVDCGPAWDPEGKYLFFIGERDFNPVYDALQFDLSFPQASRPFAIALTGNISSPFVPKPAPLHRERRHDEEERKKDEKPPRVDIDFDGIAGRIIGFPVEEGQYGELVAAATVSTSRSFRSRASSRALTAGTTTKRAERSWRSTSNNSAALPLRRTWGTFAYRPITTRSCMHRRIDCAPLTLKRTCPAKTMRPNKKSLPKPAGVRAGSISDAPASKSSRAKSGRKCFTKPGAFKPSSFGTRRCPASTGRSRANATKSSCRGSARGLNSPTSCGNCSESWARRRVRDRRRSSASAAVPSRQLCVRKRSDLNPYRIERGVRCRHGSRRIACELHAGLPVEATSSLCSQHCRISAASAQKKKRPRWKQLL